MPKPPSTLRRLCRAGSQRDGNGLSENCGNGLEVLAVLRHDHMAWRRFEADEGVAAMMALFAQKPLAVRHLEEVTEGCDSPCGFRVLRTLGKGIETIGEVRGSMTMNRKEVLQTARRRIAALVRRQEMLEQSIMPSHRRWQVLTATDVVG